MCDGSFAAEGLDLIAFLSGLDCLSINLFVNQR